MSETIHPAEMTPQERLQEVAAILARGILRLQMGGRKSSAKDRQKPLTLDRN